MNRNEFEGLWDLASDEWLHSQDPLPLLDFVWRRIEQRLPRPEGEDIMSEDVQDRERYRWLRDQCSKDRRIAIAEYADSGDLLDHHIDKARCGL